MEAELSIERKPKTPPTLAKTDFRQARAKAIAKEPSNRDHSLWTKEISDSHPIFANHFAYDQALLPGLAYIDIILEFCETLGLTYDTVEIRDLSIFQPMTIDPGDRLQLNISAEEEEPGRWAILIMGDLQGDQSQNQHDPARYARATVSRIEPEAFLEKVELGDLLRQSHTILSMEEAYKRWRGLGLVHGGIMKARGNIHISTEQTWIELIAEDTASDPARVCIVHPVIVDGSIVGAVELIASSASGEKRLFLPIHFHRFRTTERLHNACFARIRTNEVVRKGELISVNIDYFDLAGRKIGELEGFNNKLVRAPSFISGEKAEPKKSVEKSQLKPMTLKDGGAADLVKDLFSHQLGTTEDSLDLSGSYYDLGLTSAMMIDIVKMLGDHLGVSLSPTLLFEYTTAGALIDYLLDTYSDRFRPENGGVVKPAPAPAPANPNPSNISNSVGDRHSQRIAVIGMSGRYPGSNMIQEFWDNLLLGKDCITEIPSSRWNSERLNGIKSPSGKSMSRWGGFLDDVARFDPLFFKISPKEAASIDPQERLFLEICWEALEDAGYTPQNVVAPHGRNQRRKVGVFTGVMHKDYAFLASEALWNGADTSISLNYAPIANRVSYVCDFHGPSIAVDTVCSASLTAVHMAMESIRSGECEVALAGGVNLSLHPNKYITYGTMDMHSTDGRCRSFGDGGDGYVSAEGVGAVLLKPLEKAEADGDHIYGVLIASAVNHVGKASGMTVPSPVAQGDMILECLDKAGVEARSISYIEAHGTGTSLGDPIEVQGLSRAFRSQTQDVGFCAVGSIKSNIGHAESAAGISGLSKTLLQLKHKMLAPTLHSEKLNPHIQLSDTPFYLPHRATHWPAEEGVARRAGISSFGATGSNAHVLVEEYIERRSPAQDLSEPTDVLLPLSAHSQEQLRDYALRLERHLERMLAEKNDIDLRSLAYTLQVGRVSCSVRMIVRASDAASCIALLRQFRAGSQKVRNIWHGAVNPSSQDFLSLLDQDDLQNLMVKWVSIGRLDRIASAWVQGATIDWQEQYPAGGRRMSLPTYPFEQEHYWVPEPKPQQHAENNLTKLHPLLHENVSNLVEQRYRSKFLGSEIIFDHSHAHGKILPLVGLEIAALALHNAWPTGGAASQMIHLEDISWNNAQAADGYENMLNVTLHVDEGDSASNLVHYEVSTERDQEGTNVAILSGNARMLGHRPRSRGSLSELKSRLIALGGPSLGQFKSRIGPAEDFPRSLRDIHAGQNELLCEFEFVPSNGSMKSIGWALHTAIDLHALAEHPQSKSLIRDFSGAAFSLSGDMPDRVFIHVRKSEVPSNDDSVTTLDIVVSDDQGNIFGEIRNLASSITVRTDLVSPSEHAPELMLLEENWIAQSMPASADVADLGVCVVLLSEVGSTDLWSTAFRKTAPEVTPIFATISPGLFERISSNRYSIDCSNEEWSQRLLASIKEDFGAVNTVLCVRALDESAAVTDLLAVTDLVQGASKIGEPLTRLVVAGRSAAGDTSVAYLDALVGFARSIQVAVPELRTSIVRFEVGDRAVATDRTMLADLLMADLLRADTTAVLYRGNERFVPSVNTIGTKISGKSLEMTSAFRFRGTYLITGGAGGIGLSIARHLAEKFGANSVLVGRSRLSDEQAARIREIEALGGQILYFQADVGNLADMQEVVSKAEERLGALDGVFHAAGAVSSIPINKKTREDVEGTLRAKVAGTQVLAVLFETREVDFIKLFSSSAAFVGDLGSCDYATANRFQIAFAAAEREKQASRWIVAAWPLWRDGGMKLGPEATERYVAASGQHLLQTEMAMELLEHLIGGDLSGCLVQFGERERVFEVLSNKINIQGKVRSKNREKAIAVVDVGAAASAPGELIVRLKEIASQLLAIPLSRLTSHANFSDFGFDSITFATFASKLNDAFSTTIVPSDFYTHSTFHELADYVRKEGTVPEVVAPSAPMSPIAPDETTVTSALPLPVIRPVRHRTLTQSVTKLGAQSAKPGAIAIVGLSGKFPGAENIEEMWDILSNGRSTIEDLPNDRLKLQLINDIPNERRDQRRRLGRIDGYAQFDAAFFEVSPREADAIDPRQRLLLQESWRALEDAALCGEALETARIGVFVGAEQGDYQQLQGEATLTSNHDGILASRLSYFLNLKGPVLSINTACSSGLVALHQACLSLRGDECDIAVVSAVNLLLSPQSFATLADAEMLSPTGQCFAFDGRADGIVPGEAVVSVVLRRLSDAEADGDPIRAVIIGGGVNHDGKTNGITAPSGKAQHALISGIHERFGIDPTSIGHVVTHGTGTRLGDPVEIGALNSAFREKTTEEQFCAVTSTKPNFGHGFAASGLTSLVSLVQGFAHNAIPPSINCDQPSDYFKWAQSPFFVNQELRPWPIGEQPRVGAISAFGMSGTNAHVVVQDHSPAVRVPNEQQALWLLPLTAKTDAALTELAHQLASFLRQGAQRRLHLAGVAETLRAGRKHFKKRLAVLANSTEEAAIALESFANGIAHTNVVVGEVPRDFTEDPHVKAELQLFGEQGFISGDGNDIRVALLSLARHFVEGYRLPALGFNRAHKPYRLHLPTYPFKLEHHLKRGAVNEEDMSGELPPVAELPLLQSEVDGTVEALSTDHFYQQYWVDATEPSASRVDLTQGKTLLVTLGKHGPVIEALIRQHQDPDNEVVLLVVDEEVENGLSNLCDDAWCQKFASNAPLFQRAFVLSDESERRETDGELAILVEGLPKLFNALFGEKRIAVSADIYVVAFDGVSAPVKVTPSGLPGLGHWLAQAFPSSRVRNLDVRRVEGGDSLGARRTLEVMLRTAASRRGEVVRIRGVNKTRMQFRHLNQNVGHLVTAIRQGGVYVIVGGSGTIGRRLAEFLVEKYGALVACIGRKSEAELFAKGAGLESNEKITYFSADVTRSDEIVSVLYQIRKRWGSINGAIFAAAQIEGTDVTRAVSHSANFASAHVKLAGARNLYEALKTHDIDFLCYFSSIQTYDFVDSVGTLGYAVGCNWADAYAESLSDSPFPIGVINWGYWAASIVGTPWEKQLNGKFGLLSDQEGLAAFDTFIRMLGSGGPKRVIVMKAEASIRSLLELDGRQSWRRSHQPKVPMTAAGS